MERLFANSNVGDLVNLSAFADWKFYEDFMFYVVAGLTVMYLLSLLLVNTVLKDYCLINNL